MKEIGIGLLGFGTVGAGVVKGLQENGDLLARRLGVRPVLRRIADLDLESDRGVAVPDGVLCNDADSVIDDPECQIIVEMVGGTTAADHMVRKALEHGKPVVTANKALLAEKGAEIFELAGECGADLYFGASVGGGIPIIRVLREGLVGNRVQSIYGILNGTCNYILTRMERERLSFDEVLAAAQEQGYAEADPSLDIDGLDTAHKAVILASLACGRVVPMESVYVNGIRGIEEADIRYALDLGYRIKMLAVIKQGTDMIEVRVQPALVPLDHMLASVSGVFNAVMIRSDLLGDTLYYGKGAGREPTASTVIGDIGDICRNIAGGTVRHVPPVPRFGDVRIKDMNEIRTRYYLRMSVLDKPGAFARIADRLGQKNVSIASVLQKEVGAGKFVPVVLVTHEATEQEISLAIKEIDDDEVVGARTVKLTIEE